MDPNAEDANSEGTDDGDRKPAAKETEDSAGESASDQGNATTQQHKGRDKSNHALRWEEMYIRLCDFHRRFGHSNVPNRYSEDPQLGSWVSAQRRAYKTITSGATGSTAMTLERATKLKKLGFEWEAINPNNVPWETRYEELLAFVKKYGHANVPMRWKENVQLSNWVSKQRHDHKLLQRGTSSRLTEKRRKLLNDVGFIWEVERGSSVAQLQRVAVVGPPTRKPKNKDTVSEGEASITPSRSATSQTQTTGADNLVEATTSESTLPSLSINEEVANSTSVPARSAGAATLAPNAGQALGFVRTNDDPPTSSHNTGTVGDSADGNSPFAQTQGFHPVQGSNTMASTPVAANPGRAEVGVAQPFLGLNLPSPNNAATNLNQPQQPMIILPILAMMPPTQGPAGSLTSAQLLPLAPIVQNHSATNFQAASHPLTALQSFFGGSAAAHNPAAALGALFGGNMVNPMGSGGSPSAPSQAASLQASLALLASAMGMQHPQAQTQMGGQTQMSPAMNTPMTPTMLGAQSNQTAMGALSALFANSAGGAHQLAGPNMAASTTSNDNAQSTTVPNFLPAGPIAAHLQPNVVNALASTLAQFFQPSAQPPASTQAQQPPPARQQPPAQGPNEAAAQNFASALSHFFQNNPQTTGAQPEGRRHEDPEDQEPPEKRARTS